jgi:hypothetical protein
MMETVVMTGNVAQASFARGTKSQRKMLKIKTDSKEYYLQPVNQNPFEITLELKKLIGKRVRVKGFVQGRTLFAQELEICTKK